MSVSVLLQTFVGPEALYTCLASVSLRAETDDVSVDSLLCCIFSSLYMHETGVRP